MRRVIISYTMVHTVTHVLLFRYHLLWTSPQYQDYHCSEEEKHMECPVDPDMSIVGITHAKVRLYMNIYANAVYLY